MSKPTARMIDVRLIERNVRQGLLTRKEVAKMRESLPDVASKSVTLGEVEQQRIARGDTDDDD